MTRLGARRSVLFFSLSMLLGVGAAMAQEEFLFTTIPAVEMVHYELGGRILRQGTSLADNGGWSAYCTGTCELVADAGLPHGATVVGIEIDACRDSPTAGVIQFGLLRRLKNDMVGFLFGPRIDPVVFDTVDDTGCFYRVAVPSGLVEVDLLNNEYVVAVIIPPFGCGTVENPCKGARFQAIRVYYEANESGVVEPSKRGNPFAH